MGRQNFDEPVLLLDIHMIFKFKAHMARSDSNGFFTQKHTLWNKPIYMKAKLLY